LSSLIDRLDVLQQTLAVLPVGVWIMDSAGVIRYGNPAALEIWGGARYVGMDRFQEYRGWWVSSGEPIGADEWAAARALTRGETSIDEEVEIETFDGTRKIILNSAIPIRAEDGRVEGAIIVNIDITRRKRMEMRLREISERDYLTNTYNRRQMYRLLSVELARARRYGTPLAVMMFDVDNFKAINDTYGHIAGDTILRRMVDAIHEQLRTSDHFIRFGGEEFIVVLPGIDVAAGASLAERLRELVKGIDFEFVSGITCSFGVCEPREDDDIDALIRRVDRLLYRAKHGGRDRVVSD
jgi:diguanylate cyclase (GGDEF)-like protein